MRLLHADLDAQAGVRASFVFLAGASVFSVFMELEEDWLTFVARQLISCNEIMKSCVFSYCLVSRDSILSENAG